MKSPGNFISFGFHRLTLYPIWLGVGGVPSPREAGAWKPEFSGVRAPRLQNPRSSFASNALGRALRIFTGWLLSITAGCISSIGYAQETTSLEKPLAPPGWHLVWSDEFDRPGAPDPARWSYDVGGDGWGNRELQFYTKARRENARVEAGNLVIEARRESWQGAAYTSARLVTKNKGDWPAGRFEIRARVPLGRGTWPAIWMLPTVWNLGNGQWPDNGEIDIMEHVGHEPGVVHASTHSRKNQWKNNTQRTAITKVPDAGDAFHTYALEWDAEEIRIYVDDLCYFTSRKDGGDWTTWPFTRNFYLVLNLAVGGDWGSVKGIDQDAFPQRMEVDFVRVYQRDPVPAVAR